MATKAGLASHTVENYRVYARKLTEHFGQILVSEVDAEAVATLQQERMRKGYKPRRINLELAVLRMILRHFGCWDSLKGRTKPLRERHDVGRAIAFADERKILDAIGASRSAALLPLFVVCIDTGIRADEARSMRHRDLGLVWRGGVAESGTLTVSKSKTEGGTGRTIPLTRRACAVLSVWLARFPEANPEHFVFPLHKVSFAGNSRAPWIYEVELTRPLGSWKKAWRDALARAGLHYRWHDTRHSFVSRLAENPAVSEQTLMALAGHVSKAMLARYSHIRTQAKQAAIAALEGERDGAFEAEFAGDSPQKPPQPVSSTDPILN